MGTSANLTIKSEGAIITLRKHYDADLALGGATIYEAIQRAASTDRNGKIRALTLAYALVSDGWEEMANNREPIQYEIDIEFCKITRISYQREITKGWKDGKAILEIDSDEWQSPTELRAVVNGERVMMNGRIRKINAEHGETYSELEMLD